MGSYFSQTHVRIKDTKTAYNTMIEDEWQFDHESINDPNVLCTRRFLVLTPPGQFPGKKLPAVLLFPGTDETAVTSELVRQVTGETSWQELAQKEGFYLIICEAQPIKNELKPNAYTWEPTEIDLNYVSIVVSHVVENYPVHPSKVHAVGFSNGGLFISELAIFRSNLFNSLCNYMGGISYIPGMEQGAFSDVEIKQILSEFGKYIHSPKKAVGRKIPIYIITGTADDNHTPCIIAKKEFQKEGWEIEFEDIPNQHHTYLASKTMGIWNFFKSKVDIL